MQNTDQIIYKDIPYQVSWIKSNQIDKDNISPIKQVYALVIDSKTNILICREDANSPWQLPGGKPEANESIKETVDRELLEEVDVTVQTIVDLGYNEITNLQTNEKYYQLRFIAYLDKELEQTPDPDKNFIWERKWIPLEQVKDYIKWGNAGNGMFDDAVNLLK